MLGLVSTGWNWVLARLNGHYDTTSEQHPRSAEISDRIRARYDTARRQPERPTKSWLRERGVLDDWKDAWRTVDR